MSQKVITNSNTDAAAANGKYFKRLYSPGPVRDSSDVSESPDHIRSSPVLQRAFTQMKPKKSIWGFLGVVLFFIAPEIVAFIWGAEITRYARVQLLQTFTQPLETWYELLIMMFKDGGSWVNLGLGFVFLAWLFF